jgi:hypothetical protein
MVRVVLSGIGLVLGQLQGLCVGLALSQLHGLCSGVRLMIRGVRRVVDQLGGLRVGAQGIGQSSGHGIERGSPPGWPNGIDGARGGAVGAVREVGGGVAPSHRSGVPQSARTRACPQGRSV